MPADVQTIEAPLTRDQLAVRWQGAPELCVEIAPASNPLPKLREKAMAYLAAGAVDAWILLPQTRQSEIYGRGARQDSTSFPVDVGKLFD